MKITLNLDEVLFKPALDTLEDFTTFDVLKSRYQERLSNLKGKGIDRLGTEAFERQLDAQLKVIERKVLSGRYRFSSYLERLVPKGRDKPPRVLSVPTIRDRLVLLQLKEYLHVHLPTSVNRRIPNEYIRDVRAFCESRNLQQLSYIRTDIKSFFDTIDQGRLMALLAPGIPDERTLGLIKNAIRTPTIPPGTHRVRRGRRLNGIGVPQGLAISNVLANVYLRALDAAMSAAAPLYLRYVDDILIFIETDHVEDIRGLLTSELERMGLSANPDKSTNGVITEHFEYLGYAFKLPQVSIRRAGYERFMGGVAALFARYQHRLRHNEFPPYLSPQLRRDVFVDELNDKITGAFNGARRYGWLMYFIEINDQRLLHELDGGIRNLFSRLPDFDRQAPANLRKLTRTYFEARFSPGSGYIRNYNELNTLPARLAFLVDRGIIDPADAQKISPEEVNRRFEDYKRRQLQRLEMDVGFIS